VNIKEEISKTLEAALTSEFPQLGNLAFEVSRPRRKAFGDFATNLAMVAAKALGRNPIEVAQSIIQKVGVPSSLIASLEVKKPGFINVTVSREAYSEKLREIATFPTDGEYASTTIGKGKKVQVEFVSANPTGPLNVVSARAAAVGDALVRLLRRIGYDAKSEFYVNDTGTQVELLGKSLEIRFRQSIGEHGEIPEGGYPGEYLKDIALKVRNLAFGTNRFIEREGNRGYLPDLEDEYEHMDEYLKKTSTSPDESNRNKALLQDYLAFRARVGPEDRQVWPALYVCHLSGRNLSGSHITDRLIWIERYRSTLARGGAGSDSEQPVSGGVAEGVFLGRVIRGTAFDFARFAVEEIINQQRASLERFGSRPEGGLHFDAWVRESHLEGEVDQVYRNLISDGRFVVDKDGAAWLKGGGREDEDEWVIRRRTGQHTYFLSDIAYHVYKRKRGFQEVIDIWGPDHHAHVSRMRTAMRIMSEVVPDLEIDEEWLRVLMVQQVNFVREGKRVQMSKRAGEYVTLDDVVNEVGADAARFFFLMRRSNSHLDFDLDLAKKTSEENPVYYVQYAHARISSIVDFARENGYREFPPPNADISLLTSQEETDLIKGLADFDQLVRVSALALEPHRIITYLIDTASQFHRFYHNHRVIASDRSLSEARLYLCWAMRTVLRSGLSLIGISAPHSM
jgi:arginyl-tRNA synthetase